MPVIRGDTPPLRPETTAHPATTFREEGAAPSALTACLLDAFGYGFLGVGFTQRLCTGKSLLTGSAKCDILSTLNVIPLGFQPTQKVVKVWYSWWSVRCTYAHGITESKCIVTA